MDLKKLEDYSLNDNDIHKIVGSDTLILPYSALSQVNDITTLLNQHPKIVIFFEEEKHGKSEIGHWEAIKMIGHSIQFFDSYGLIYDKAREWLSENQLVKLKEVKPELHRLFMKAYDDGYQILYNHIQYQKYNKNISTCGRFASVFLVKGDLRKNQFQNFMINLVKQYNVRSYDEAITKFVWDNWGI